MRRAAAPESDGDGGETPKVYTKEELDSLNMGQLREIADPMGISARAKGDLVAKILEAQG